MKRYDPLDKPRATPSVAPIKTRDLPNRHHFAIRPKGFWICNNCEHYTICVWTDPITHADKPPSCWTCGSFDVSHRSGRPAAKDTRINLKKARALLKAMGEKV